QRIRTQGLIARQLDFNEEDITLAARHDAQRELETVVLVHDAHRGHSRSGERQGVAVHPLHLHPESLSIGDDDAEIADLRKIDARMIDLVEDAAADREPEPRGTERAADHLLGAARPGGRQAGRARRVRRAHRLDVAGAGAAARCWREMLTASGSSPLHKCRPPLKALRLSPSRALSGSSFRCATFPPPNTT